MKANRKAQVFEFLRSEKKPVNARRSAPTGWFRIKPNAQSEAPRQLRHHSNLNCCYY